MFDAVLARHGDGEPLDAAAGAELGLVTLTPDDGTNDELRIAVEERASLSPNALTGSQANHRSGGPEPVETKIFGRRTAGRN